MAPTLTDTGLETMLVFHHGVDLPEFASFPLLDDPQGRDLLASYYRRHLQLASERGAAIVLETPTWRASSDWGAKLGYDAAALDRVNREAVAFVRGLAGDYPRIDVTVSGNLGPRGDAYAPEEVPTADEAERYHAPQIASFRAAGADRVTVLTITHASEAIGIVKAAVAEGIDVVASSPPRPMVGCRAGRACWTRWPRSTMPPTVQRSISASTARTPITSPPRSFPATLARRGWRSCVPTRRG